MMTSGHPTIPADDRRAATEFGFTAAEVASILSNQYRRGEHIIRLALAAHFLVGLGLAPFYGTWLMAICVGAAAVECSTSRRGSFHEHSSLGA